MPYLNQYIDVDEFLSNCSEKELDDVVDHLIRRRILHKKEVFTRNNSSACEKEFSTTLNKLYKNYLQITNEEEDTINKIASKFI